MDKINLKHRRKCSQTNMIKEMNPKYITISNSSCSNIILKDESSLPIIETFNKYKDNLKIIIRKNIPQESSQSVLKQVNIIMNRIYDIIVELNYQINLYQNELLYNESKIRDLQGKMFTELLNKEILQNNINSLIQKEKDYELIKEKTGILVNNGKIINTNRKDNEIIILRTENSTLKGVIEQYEIKLLQIEKEFNKKNMNFIKEKNELISRINNLIQEIKGKQSSNYSRYNIAKNKLKMNNKKSYEFSRTIMNDSNDVIINNNPSYVNMLKANDNKYYNDYLNGTNFYDMKMNTIAATHLNTINHSHKNSSYNAKVKDQFKKYEIENYYSNKENHKNNINNDILDNTIINKTFNQNKIIKKRSINKTLANKIYNKIIIKDASQNKLKDIKNEIINSGRIKTKSHESNMSKNENVNVYNNNNLNSYFIKNKRIKKIIHKKTSSSKISSIPFNNNIYIDKKENNISNKENNKNESNLVNIKNLILTKGQKNNKSKINIIYRNLVSNSLSNHNSINNSRNVHSKYNMAKLYTFNNTKVPTPRSFANN